MNAFAENAFDWVPFYSELANKLVPLRTRQQELIAFIEERRAEGLKVTQLEDKDAAGNRFLLTEIDPFTFLRSSTGALQMTNAFASSRALKRASA